MAIGRITGSVLKSNLTRNGVDLAFETNLLYLDVTNSRVGIGTSEPSTELQVAGTATAVTLAASTGLETNLVTSTNFYINDSADIFLDAAGGDIILKKGGGTQFGYLTNDNDNFVVKANVSDKDLIFRGNDGGTEISPVTIDMSEGGIIGIGTADASYTALNTLTINTASDIPLYIHSTDANNSMVMSDTNGSIKFGTASGGFTVSVGGDAGGGTKPSATSHYANGASEKFAVSSAGVVTISGAYSLPTADGSNGQVLQTDGSGALSFAESGGGGGGNNTAVKQFNYYKLDTTSAVVDEFDIKEFRGAIYDVAVEDQTNNFVGHLKVSIIHDDTTPYISVYNVNEDSTRIVDFTVAISGDVVQLSAATNTSTHTNLRFYRIALGDHHETVANTNSKIIATSTNIGSTATTLDQFTKTDIRGAKYVILIKDDTSGDYQISEKSLVHDGTTVYHDDYAMVSSRGTPLHSFTGTISGQTVTLSSLSGGNTTGTAVLYRQDLGTKTKLGEFDNFHYGIKKDIDSAVETVDSFDVFKFKTARYFITMESGSEYQNSEITMTVNSAGTDATISESFVLSANNTLATFSADVSGGKARLRASCNPNTKIFFARLSFEANNIYRANGQTSDDLYITHNNLKLEPGALTIPKGTTAQRPSLNATGMIRYNTSTDSYERYDTSGWVNIAKTATATEASGTTTGEATSISTTAVNVDTFDKTSFDSAFYQMVTRDEINDEIATQTVSLVHNDTDAFTSTGGIVRSGSNTQVAFDADISGSTVRLRGTGTADVNSVKFFRIGLGDNTSASSSGNTATIINTDVDSATENLDTWSASSYRGAKYYISANNSTKTELNNIECLVVHNGTDAFITVFNDIFTGSNSLISLSADIDSGSVRLRASGNEPNTAVKMYRVLLGDSESDATSDNTKTIGQVTVSSSATEVDTFSTDSFNGAHYVVVGNNSTESAASISEVFVVTDGTDAFVTTAPQVSTKGTDQLEFTASLSGSTVSLSASSTSGGSTTVNGFRVQLLRNPAGASTSLSVLTTNAQTISGAKTFTADVTLNDDVKLKLGTGGDLEIYHDGANSYIDDAGTGTIFYRSGTQTFSNAAGSKTMAVFNAASSVDLNFNNNTKFQTTNHGVQLTGVMRMAIESGDPSTVADTAHIYAKDESASAEVFVQDEAGNVTKISPHNEQGEWEYFSRNTKTGKTVRVNMEEMIRDIEKLTGKKYIKND